MNNKDKKKTGLYWCGGIIGVVGGLSYALTINPPLKGIFESSTDVAGLSIASWFIFSLVGGICGFFLFPIVYGVFFRLFKGSWPNHKINADGK